MGKFLDIYGYLIGYQAGRGPLVRLVPVPIRIEVVEAAGIEPAYSGFLKQ